MQAKTFFLPRINIRHRKAMAGQADGHGFGKTRCQDEGDLRGWPQEGASAVAKAMADESAGGQDFEAVFFDRMNRIDGMALS
jgi:hypothetical protein